MMRTAAGSVRDSAATCDADMAVRFGSNSAACCRLAARQLWSPTVIASLALALPRLQSGF